MTRSNKPEGLPIGETSDQDTPPLNHPYSTAEWISLGISSVLLAGVIGAASFLWASEQQRQPPILGITQSDTRLSDGEYYVPFTVTNAGGETAESVQVVAELRIDGEVVESGEQTLEFLSSQETTGGAFIFTRNPQDGELVMRVASYQEP
jgi:uncharacterized protein (TIGR02588 family)